MPLLLPPPPPPVLPPSAKSSAPPAPTRKRHHGQPAVLDLLQLVLLRDLRALLGQAEGVKGAAWVGVLGALEGALQAEEGPGLGLRVACGVGRWAAAHAHGSWHGVRRPSQAAPRCAHTHLAAGLADVLPPLALHKPVHEERGDQQGACACACSSPA